MRHLVETLLKQNVQMIMGRNLRSFSRRNFAMIHPPCIVQCSSDEYFRLDHRVFFFSWTNIVPTKPRTFLLSFVSMILSLTSLVLKIATEERWKMYSVISFSAIMLMKILQRVSSYDNGQNCAFSMHASSHASTLALNFIPWFIDHEQHDAWIGTALDI